MIFGNYNPFTLSLISRLDKEGHTVFVVTGDDRKTTLKPKSVFQEYNFSFQSSSIEVIVENVKADIAIFESAIDSLVDLENQNRKILNYISSVTSVILSLKNSNLKKLIYVSSLRVFSGNSEKVISETTVPKPLEDSEKAILLGEKICTDYYKDTKFKIDILRFSELYGTYNSEYLRDNKVAEICRKIIKNKSLTITSNKSHNLIYIDDAVDAMYKVLLDEKDSEIYHIAADEDNVCLEKDILDAVRDYMPLENDFNVVEVNTEDINTNYSTEKLKKLNFNEKYKLKDTVPEVYKTIKKARNERDASNTQKTSILTRIFKIDSELKNRIFPFLENIIFFILLSIIIYITRDMAIHNVVDVYLLYVVVIALVYGYEQTVFAVILSVASKLYFTYTLASNLVSQPDYYIYLWILEIFTIGILVGYLKEQYRLKYLDMKDENEYLNTTLMNIKNINKNNEEIKELYEKRLINYKDSFGRIYEIVSELDIIQPRGVIFKAISVIGKIMNTTDVSIYIYSGNADFFRLMASSSDKAKTLKSSLKVSEYTSLFDKLLNHEIFVNTDLDSNCPIMAGGTYKDDKLQTIIMIWTLPFESNNLYQRNVFGVACKLIERSINIGYEYVSSISKNFNQVDDNVIDADSFENIVRLYREGAKENIVEFYLIEVKRDNETNPTVFNDMLKSCVRDTDFIGEGKDGKMNILLTNTGKSESVYVIDRLKNGGIEVVKGELLED